ncbi:MAG: hypothetical protein EOP49_05715 [Sphingobacteriales bacterium]|nr:MAG: hypothetical protein EOP49_05715 [Sphingobacteriales bacterium]
MMSEKINKGDNPDEKDMDSSIKKDGVTSSFSASTGEPGKYSGEDITAPDGSTGSNEDKIASPAKTDPAESDAG